MLGISIKSTIGIGDALQFSSLPENYYRHTGQYLYDVSRPWFFDHNPYVKRDETTPNKTIEMWNFGPNRYEWPKLREESVFLSNAEVHASVLNVPVVLNRPRLYQYEYYPFEKREKILLHVDGRSHGLMPANVIKHIVEKYGKTGQLYQIGKTQCPGLEIPKIETPTLWELALEISKARMFIGMDSGPSWIANCYCDVITKKLRTKPAAEYFKTWVPLAKNNIHSHWDDRAHQVFNPTEDDIGFTYSFRRI